MDYKPQSIIFILLFLIYLAVHLEDTELDEQLRSHLTVISGDCGYCTNVDDVSKVVNIIETVTNTKYVSMQKSKDFGKEKKGCELLYV